MERVKEWHFSGGFWVAFHEDGSSFTAFYRKSKEVPYQLRVYLERMASEQGGQPTEGRETVREDFNDYSQEELREIIIRLCCRPTQEEQKRKVFLEKFKDIALTRDNVAKLALLYLRLKAGIPIVMVGETGVGKTVLVNILNYLVGGKVSSYQLHAGTKESEIRKWVKKRIAKFYLSRIVKEFMLKRGGGST